MTCVLKMFRSTDGDVQGASKDALDMLSEGLETRTTRGLEDAWRRREAIIEALEWSGRGLRPFACKRSKALKRPGRGLQ